MAKRKVKLVRPGDEQTTWRGAGDEYRMLATGEDTAGDYFIMEAIVPPGGGPTPHIQTREEEAFYVLEGEVVFRADGERIVAQTGAYLNIPRDVPHYFKNESATTTTGPEGIENGVTSVSPGNVAPPLPSGVVAVTVDSGGTFTNRVAGRPVRQESP